MSKLRGRKRECTELSYALDVLIAEHFGTGESPEQEEEPSNKKRSRQSDYGAVDVESSKKKGAALRKSKSGEEDDGLKQIPDTLTAGEKVLFIKVFNQQNFHHVGTICQN